MRRPTSLVGLFAYVAWLHRRRVAAFATGVGCAALGAVVAFAPPVHRTQPAARCDAYELWNAGLHVYDYLDSVDLRARTHGEAARGESQVLWSVVRFDVRRLAPRAMEWSHFVDVDPYTDDERPIDAPPRRVGFQIDEGEFRVVVPDFRRGTERVYRCRLRFDDDPRNEVSDYYAVLLRSRPL